MQRPHPLFLVGGMSKPAARRAARRGLPFGPPIASPDLEALYFEELAAHGHEGGYVHTPPADFSVLFIAEDPNRAWQELGEYFLVEAVEYSSWKEEGLQRPLEFESSSVEALREEKRYEIITPEECIHRHKTREQFFATLHPLIGGMPLQRAWDCLKLYTEQVLPAL